MILRDDAMTKSDGGIAPSVVVAFNIIPSRTGLLWHVSLTTPLSSSPMNEMH
jgi:hypothetical protein